MTNFPKNAPEMLASMARMYNHDLTSFESMLWAGEIFSVYNDKDIILALKHYMENGTQSRFMPRYGDIKQLLAVEDDTLGEIRLLVSRYGSYNPPSPSETTPLLLATIEQLGGWSTVCAEMPDSSESMLFTQYAKRAEKACQAAKKRVAIYKQTPNALLGRQKQMQQANLVALEFDGKACGSDNATDFFSNDATSEEKVDRLTASLRY